MILNAIESGSGPTLVLLHGLFGAGRNFGAVQRILSEQFRVLALDLRNHGDSPHDSRMDYGAMAADVLETLRARNALPCALVGHSMGGKAAMRTALQEPAAIARLVVSDIAPVAYPPAFRAYADAMLALALRPGLTRAAADEALAGAIPEPGVRGFLLQNLRPGAQPGWRIGLREIADALPEIEGWSAPPGAVYPGPALFVSGSRSDYIRIEHRPAIRALFPAARFVAVKDAGHWVHADNPAGFAAVVQSFLTSQS
jgi:pimeloyl-ACP methyl ester carboxylesterase